MPYYPPTEDPLVKTMTWRVSQTDADLMDPFLATFPNRSEGWRWLFSQPAVQRIMRDRTRIEG